MLKNFLHQSLLTILVGLSSLLINLPLKAHEENIYPSGFHIQNPFKSFSLSHTEGKGLGYSQGYTSLDLFLTYPLRRNKIIPFVDLRGHAFNNGKCAANVGLGLRRLNSCCDHAWGINFFYDSLRTSHRSYSQISFGLESLSETWNIRMNGYLPVGHKKTPIYRLSYDFSSGFLAKAREQFAMGGIDAEVGYHFSRIQCVDIYTGLGPYVYWGRSQKTENAFRAASKEAIGGRFRASARFLTYFELEGIATYDSRFNWGGQVTLSLNISFEQIFSVWNHIGCSNPCCSTFSEMLFLPVVRNEIIVVDRINRFSSNPLILDPEFNP